MGSAVRVKEAADDVSGRVMPKAAVADAPGTSIVVNPSPRKRNALTPQRFSSDGQFMTTLTGGSSGPATNALTTN